MQDMQDFDPPWWLKNKHIQSCFSAVFRPRCQNSLRWEQLDLPDGDFIDLCWSGKASYPIVILLHGLEGSYASHYIQLMIHALTQANWHVVVMNFRACSGRLNRLPRSYHAGDTRDLDFLVKTLRYRFPTQPITAVGFSLGGNVLLHHLIHNPASPLAAAVAVSVPFELARCADFIPPLYRWSLLRSMKTKSIQKILLGQPMPATIDEIKKVFDFRSFDDLLTAPLHNFRDADDYYVCATVRGLLKRIEHSTLIIHAEDDPLIPCDTIPLQNEFSASTIFDLHKWGGHVGFVSGDLPWRIERWFRLRILDFLRKSV
ncbi:MAG: hypothetical protein A3F10_02175 [Coxiella sp. RIFCSPHIGHO2_12_FULL_42_15]|nr:MAG: hypothetical protein A3F10_02175 [Coxiella sp. RIFCSPHIGHO2_12_FULL_42_15]